MMEPESDVVIQEIQFPPGVIVVHWVERDDVNAVVALSKNIAIDIEQVEDDAEMILELARRIVDQGLVLKRNPPAKIRGGKALAEEVMDEGD